MLTMQHFSLNTLGKQGWRSGESTAVNRLGQVFVLFREILFTMNWKHEQGRITIAVECKCIPISLI